MFSSPVNAGVPVNKDSKSNDVKSNSENVEPLKPYVIPKFAKKVKGEPTTVKSEFITNAEFIASQISPPKV